jgi:hypothetical protein
MNRSWTSGLWLTLVVGCAATPPTRVRDKRPRALDDDWERSVVWLHATAGASSGATGECKHVHDLLAGENRCRGQLCTPGSELAAEWQDKCGAADSGEDPLGDAKRHFETELARQPSACFRDYLAITDGPCEGEACHARAQTWATRCAETEASALALTVVRTLVRRAAGSEAPRLDERSCSQLSAAVATGAKCADEADCRKAANDVRVHDQRCANVAKASSLTLAIQRAAVLAGAGEQPKPSPVDTSEALDVATIPLPLADRLGAVLTVCGRRVVAQDAFLATRERCGGGPVTFAVLRDGRLEIAKLKPIGERSIAELFPRFALEVERKQRDRAQLDAFTSALDEALASNDPPRSLRVLDDHAHYLAQTAAAQAALAERDNTMVGLLVQLAEAKVKFAGGFGRDIQHLRGMLQRGPERPLADVSLEGAVQPLAPTRASLLRLSSWLPAAAKAYRKELAGMTMPIAKAEEAAKLRARWSHDDPAAEAPALIAGANKACLAGQRAIRRAHDDLDRCALSGCSDDAILELVARVEPLRDKTVASAHRYDAAAAMTRQASRERACDPLAL